MLTEDSGQSGRELIGQAAPHDAHPGPPIASSLPFFATGTHRSPRVIRPTDVDEAVEMLSGPAINADDGHPPFSFSPSVEAVSTSTKLENAQ